MTSDKYHFAVFDIDGTLIRWQLYHATADALVKLGYFDDSIFQNVKTSRMLWKERLHDESFREYERSLVSTYDNLLTNITHKQYMEAARKVFNEYKNQSYTYTRNMVKRLKSQGHKLYAISGSQSEIVEMIAKHYGFDDFIGSRYEVKNGKFTGRKEIVKGSGKTAALKQLIASHNLSLEASIGVGDSESDIPILEMVSRPIAFNPNQALHDHASRKGWKIVVERKNVVYELEKVDGKYILA